MTGYECGDPCVKVLQEQLAAAIHDARQIASQPGCTAVDAVAKYYGKQPGWCLPAAVEVEPAPGGSNQPGGIVVRVTRNSAPAPQGDVGELHSLDVSSLGTNITRKGTFGESCHYYADGYPIKEEDKAHYYNLGLTPFIEDQEQGSLYAPTRLRMPALEPGESIDFPIALQPFGHDNTKDTYIPQVGCDGFAMFKYLFYKGNSEITATEYCLVSENGSFVPCTGGGSDVFITPNPLDPSEQWH
jgi:hypothetical protein